MQQEKLRQTCWGAKWIRQRKRDQLHIFRRTLIGGEPLSLPVSLPHPQITSLILPPLLYLAKQSTQTKVSSIVSFPPQFSKLLGIGDDQ